MDERDKNTYSVEGYLRLSSIYKHDAAWRQDMFPYCAKEATFPLSQLRADLTRRLRETEPFSHMELSYSLNLPVPGCDIPLFALSILTDDGRVGCPRLFFRALDERDKPGWAYGLAYDVPKGVTFEERRMAWGKIVPLLDKQPELPRIFRSEAYWTHVQKLEFAIHENNDAFMNVQFGGILLDKFRSLLPIFEICLQWSDMHPYSGKDCDSHG